jgi:hypothetical protein
MITPGGYQTALQIALVSLASYICGEAVTGYFHSASAKTGGMWAVMSAVVVLQPSRGESAPRVWRLIAATLIGSWSAPPISAPWASAHWAWPFRSFWPSSPATPCACLPRPTTRRFQSGW